MNVDLLCCMESASGLLKWFSVKSTEAESSTEAGPSNPGPSGTTSASRFETLNQSDCADRGVRHGPTRRTRFPDFCDFQLISRLRCDFQVISRLRDSDFSLISQMRMRERSTAHAQTVSRDFS